MNAAERRRLPFEPGTPMPGVLYIPEQIRDEYIELFVDTLMRHMSKPVKARWSDSDVKLAGDALEVIRRTQAFTSAYPSGPIIEAHDALRAFIHGGEVNQ